MQQSTRLDLNDNRKAQPRRAGLTRNYPHNLLQSLNRPKKEEQIEMPTKAVTKNRASHVNNITQNSNDVNVDEISRSRKRETKGSNKENKLRLPTSSAMKNTISIEDEEDELARLPDDSDDGAKHVADSSDDESPYGISADMTKTSFGAKNQKSSQTSAASSAPTRKSTRTQAPELKSTAGNKRKKEEIDSKHDADVDMFGNMGSGSKKLKSYMSVHKEHKFPKRTLIIRLICFN